MTNLTKEVMTSIGRNVYGEDVGGAVFYHDGHYYDGAGAYLYSNPGKQPPAGAKSTRPTLVPEAPAAPTAPVDPREARRADLSGLTVSQLQKLQRLSGVKDEDVITGEGSKLKLIEWLLDNTTA